jgi:hypothetical protein
VRATHLPGKVARGGQAGPRLDPREQPAPRRSCLVPGPGDGSGAGGTVRPKLEGGKRGETTIGEIDGCPRGPCKPVDSAQPRVHGIHHKRAASVQPDAGHSHRRAYTAYVDAVWFPGALGTRGGRLRIRVGRAVGKVAIRGNSPRHAVGCGTAANADGIPKHREQCGGCSAGHDQGPDGLVLPAGILIEVRNVRDNLRLILLPLVVGISMLVVTWPCEGTHSP